MENIKGLQKLIYLCSCLATEVDDDFDIEVGPEFMCYPTTKEIYISLVAEQLAVEDFMQNLLSRTEVEGISEFTWSLLHEIGHCQTWNYMNKRTINHCSYVKRKISRGSVPRTEYYNLSVEKVATDWAINYVENNLDLVREYDAKLRKALRNIFTINGIE